MSRKGNFWDNVPSESFFYTLKTELIYHDDFNTREEAKQAVFEYIEVFYNRVRLHSCNDYMSPLDYESGATSSCLKMCLENCRQIALYQICCMIYF